jgi:hypothetical protein
MCVYYIIILSTAVQQGIIFFRIWIYLQKHVENLGMIGLIVLAFLYY